MPRYHFHFQDGGACPDIDGTELADAESAQIAAVQYLSELLRERSSSFWECRSLEMTVSDAPGNAIFVLQVAVTTWEPLSRFPTRPWRTPDRRRTA